MIIKRKYLVTVYDDLTDNPVDYAFSNTVNGCMDYIRNSCRFFKKNLDTFTFNIMVVYD